MAKTNLSEMFGLVPKRTYWNMPEEMFANVIIITNLPDQTDPTKIHQNFAAYILEKLPQLAKTNIYFAAEQNNGVRLSLGLEAFVLLEIMKKAVESSTNQELRRIGALPNYTVVAECDKSILANLPHSKKGPDKGLDIA